MTHNICHAPNFAEKIFADGRKSTNFAKVFSLESFLLYGMTQNLGAGLKYTEQYCMSNTTTASCLLGPKQCMHAYKLS